MSQFRLLEEAIIKLEKSNIPYMLTGSIVSSLQGVPTILEKLYWSKLSGGSRKHYEDALRVYELQKEILDMDYLEKWCGKIGIRSLFLDIKKDVFEDL